MHYIILCLLFSQALTAEQIIKAAFVKNKAVIIDGYPNDPVWRVAKALVYSDPLTNKKIFIKALHNEHRLFLQIRFKDKEENKGQAALVWDEVKKLYKTQASPSDSISIRWNMASGKLNSSPSPLNYPYRADLWYWDAALGNESAYADDLFEIYSTEDFGKSQISAVDKGKLLYLSQFSDEGQAAYRAITYPKFIKKFMPQFISQEPSLDRAHVKAKGLWKNGFWCVEFSRDKETLSLNDLSFSQGSYFPLAISLASPNKKNLMKSANQEQVYLYLEP